MDNNLIMELQEKYSELQESEERINLIEQQILELETFGNSIDEIKKTENKGILASLGKGVYIPAEIKEKNLFVGVGSGIFVKKTSDEARKVVENQLLGLNGLREKFSLRMDNLNKEMQKLMIKIEEKQKTN